MTNDILGHTPKQNPKKGWLFLWDTLRWENIFPQIRYTLIVWVFNPPTSTLAADWQLGRWTITGQKSWAWNFYGWLTSFFFTKCSNIWDFSGCSMTHKKTDEWELRRIDTFRRFSAEPDTALDETEVWSDTSLELVSWGMRHWRKIWKFYVFYAWLKGLSAWMFYFGLPYIIDWRIQASWCLFLM